MIRLCLAVSMIGVAMIGTAGVMAIFCAWAALLSDDTPIHLDRWAAASAGLGLGGMVTMFMGVIGKDIVRDKL